MPYFQYKFLGKRGEQNSIVRNMIWHAQNNTWQTLHVRCVRDVIDDDEIEWKDKESSATKRRK
jgi:hypothetical protein